jgi:O-antigen/teichoic acid export membrane protein
MSEKKPKPLSFKTNAIWNSAGSIVYLGAQWLVTVIVVIFSIDYTNSGLLALAMVVGNVFAPIAMYRMRIFQVSDVGETFTPQNYVAFRLITIVTAAFFSLLYGIITHIEPSAGLLVAIYLFFKADEAFSDVLFGVEQKGQRMDYVGLSLGIRGLLSIALFAGALIYTDSLLCAIVSMAVSCALITWFYDMPHAKRFAKLMPRITITRALTLARTCFPAVLSLLFCSSILSVTRQYFATHFGIEELGIYAAVAAPVLIIQVSATYLYVPAASRIALLIQAEDKTGVIQLLLRLSVLILIAIAILSVLLALYGQGLLVIVYGSSIAAYTYLLLPLCIATGLFAYLSFLSDVLIIFRAFKSLLVASAGSLLVCLLLCIPAISRLGMNGINIVLIISYGFGLILSICLMNMHIKKL